MYKIIFLIILKIATTRNYNLEREKNYDPYEGNILTDIETSKKGWMTHIFQFYEMSYTVLNVTFLNLDIHVKF